MNAFTADSSWFVCPVCVQPAAVSAFEIEDENFVSALPRQVESTLASWATAFAWHLALFDAFFPAAWIFFESHRFGPWPLEFTMLRTLSTKLSTFDSIAGASPFGARQSPLDSALVKPAPNLELALERQSPSTICPLATAFA